MEIIVFYIIIGIIIFDFVLSSFLDYLNSTKWSSKLPNELNGIYEAEKYKKSQDYEKTKTKFSTLVSIFSFIVILLFLSFDGFSLVDNFAREYSENSIIIALIFFGILMFVSDIINTPFSIYSTFVIEERFGFNKTTIKTFVLDKLKGWGLSAIIGGGLLSVIVWFYDVTTDMFWIYTWILLSGFSLFMAMFYSNLIVPLFNKQSPLEDGELRDAIEKFSKKVGFKLDNIYKINGSKRSSKANAYFSGFGPKKRIVLYDTLINDLSISEIVAVLAHEIGHYKKKHTIKSIFISVIQTGITLYILSLFIDNPVLSKALGASTPSFHLGIITFAILYNPISTIVSLFMNIYSRKNEYEADRFASDNYVSEELINALKQLSVKNLSNLTPHPFYVFFYYSHPSLLQRIEALNSNTRTN